MQKNNVIRIIIDIVLFASVVNGWWPLIFIFGVAGIWYFANFPEAIIAGVAYDALFGMSSGMGIRGWLGTIISIVLYTIILLIKKIVRR